MAEIMMTISRQSAFGGWQPVATAGLAIDICDDVALASFACGPARVADAAAAIRAAYGVDLPAGPHRVVGTDLAIVGIGVNRWLAVSQGCRGPDLERRLNAALGSITSALDQSDARALLRVSGPRARDVLAKGFAIDLHPRAFKTNDGAVTHAAHIGAIVWQTGDAPSYDIAINRSYAASFARWISHAAGVSVPCSGHAASAAHSICRACCRVPIE